MRRNVPYRGAMVKPAARILTAHRRQAAEQALCVVLTARNGAPQWQTAGRGQVRTDRDRAHIAARHRCEQ